MNTVRTAKLKIMLAKSFIADAEEALTKGQDDVAWVSIDTAIDKLKEAMDLI